MTHSPPFQEGIDKYGKVETSFDVPVDQYSLSKVQDGLLEGSPRCAAVTEQDVGGTMAIA